MKTFKLAISITQMTFLWESGRAVHHRISFDSIVIHDGWASNEFIIERWGCLNGYWKIYLKIV